MHLTKSFLEAFETIEIVDDIVFFNGSPIGLLHPASIFCKRDQSIIVDGPKGQIDLDLQSDTKLLGSLLACGALITGDLASIELAVQHLNDPLLSRTYVYLLCVSQNLSLVNSGLNRIRNCKVLVVGCGGIGSLSAVLLCGAGINNLVLVDSDVIELSNLNRQIFWKTSDIGKPKTHVLRDAIHERFGESKNVTVLDSYVTPESFPALIGQDPNLAIVTADYPIGIHCDISDFLVENEVYVLGGGYNNALAIQYENSHKSSSIGTKRWEPIPSRYGISPSFGPVNVEVAGLLCNRAIQLIAGIAEKSSNNSLFVANSNLFPRTYTFE